MNKMTQADPAVVIDLIEAFRRSKAMFAAVSLGVFDRLAEGPADAKTLASDGDVDAMERLLDACVGLSLLAKEGNLYSNTATARVYLRRSSPQTLAGYVLYSNQILFRLWANLESAVREGSHRWNQTFGFDGPLFSHFFKTDQDMREFLLGMHGFGLLSSPAVAAAFDLSGFRRLVDLGGATGHLAMAARRRYPHLQAAVFDLHRVTEFAREFVPAGEIELIPGDFFTDALPEADLFAVGRILHDWSEPKIVTLLTKIHDRLPPGGGLLIAEKLLEDDRTGPVPAHMQSLNMLICTEGKERTFAEYKALLERAGFARAEPSKTGTPLDAILACKG